MPIFTDHPDDDNPEYDNPLGRLPNGKPCPTDDTPDGTFVTFAAESLFSQDTRNEISLAMMAHALQSTQTSALRVPANIYKHFVKEGKQAARMVRKYKEEAAANPDENTAKNLVTFTEMRKFYASAASDLAVDLSIAVNAILENMKQAAELEYPTAKNMIAYEIAKWKIGWVKATETDDDDD